MFNAMLERILAAYGPSGREGGVRGVIEEYVRPLCDELYTDALGNLIAHRKGGGKKVMLSAHMDQIGLVVTDIDEKGFIRVMNVGGVSPTTALGRRVRFKNGTMGVTGFETEKLAAKDVQLKDMFVDIGAASREGAMKLVDIGDMCVFDGQFTVMGELLSCACMDDRLCCAMIIEAMKTLDTPHDLYAVFTVQEEVGLRGAGPAAFAIQPDFNLNLDLTLVGDTPKAKRQSVALGKGPTVKAMDNSLIVPARVREFMKACAKEAFIPVQDEVLFGGGTDTAAIQRSRGGVPAGCISVPGRYIHTPVETVHSEDVKNGIRLINAILAKPELPLEP